MFSTIFTMSYSVEQPASAWICAVSTKFVNGFVEIFSAYSYNSNLYSCGGAPSVTCSHVLAFTGNGNSSTTHIWLVLPPDFQPITTASYSPDGTLTVSKPSGATCSPPIFAILPHEGSLNSFGPLPG